MPKILKQEYKTFTFKGITGVHPTFAACRYSGNKSDRKQCRFIGFFLCGCGG
jgi:hypothetical protein